MTNKVDELRKACNRLGLNMDNEDNLEFEAEVLTIITQEKTALLERVEREVIKQDESTPLDLSGRGMKALDIDCRNKLRDKQRQALRQIREEL